MKTTEFHEKSGNQMNRRMNVPLSHAAYSSGEIRWMFESGTVNCSG
jgi:hypothetical protein